MWLQPPYIRDFVMTDTSTSGGTAAPANKGPVARFIQATELDTRLLGMLGALALIWIGFHLYGAIVNGFGAFLTPFGGI